MRRSNHIRPVTLALASMHYRCLTGLIACALLLLHTGVSSTAAQVLSAPWVDEADDSIDALRKADLKIFVIDPEMRQIRGARVQVRQIRHAFPFGFRLHPESWPKAIEIDDQATRPSAANDADLADVAGATANVARTITIDNAQPVGDTATDDGQPTSATATSAGESNDATSGAAAPASPAGRRYAAAWSGEFSDLPVWRAFNAVSLEGMTAWRDIEPAANAYRLNEVATWIARSREAGLMVRWGAMVGGDEADLPAWAPVLDDAAMVTSLERYIRYMTQRFGGQVDHFDIYANQLDAQYVESRLGVPMIGRLYQQAAMVSTPRTLAFENSYAGVRMPQMMRRTTMLREHMAGFDAVVLRGPLEGATTRPRLLRVLDWFAQFDVPVILADLDIDGPSGAAASLKMEETLRTAFAHPAVQGIWFRGVIEGETASPASALINRDGVATLPGRVFEQLVRDHWWSNVEARTDVFGMTDVRVFAGDYEVLATYPSGEIARTVVRVRTDGPTQMVVIQPVAQPAAGDDAAVED